MADRVALSAVITARLGVMARSPLLAELESMGVPAGPINSVAQVFEDQQVLHRGLRVEADGVAGISSPMRFSDTPVVAPKRAPKLGEDQAVLKP